MKPSVCGTSLMSTPAPAHTSKFLRDSVSVISIGVVRLAPLMVILSVGPFADSEAGKINVARRVSAAVKFLFTRGLLSVKLYALYASVIRFTRGMALRAL